MVVEYPQTRCIHCRRRYWSTWYEHNGVRHRREAKRIKAERRARLRALMRKALSTGCKDCGEDDLRVLDFDHVSGKKIANISVMLDNLVSLETMQAEVAKCEVVCANCHRIRTEQRSPSWRSRVYKNGQLGPVPLHT